MDGVKFGCKDLMPRIVRGYNLIVLRQGLLGQTYSVKLYFISISKSELCLKIKKKTREKKKI